MLNPLFLSFLSTAFALKLNTRQAQLQWVPCNAPGLRPANGIVCSSLQVPLDYNDPSAGTATLAIAKIPAIGTRRGTIFVGSPGPGTGGVHFLTTTDGGQLFNATGRSFDLASWDSRGTGYMNPSVDCFPSPSSSMKPSSLALTEAIFNTTSFVTKTTGPTPEDIGAFLRKTAQVDEVVKQFMQDCIQRHAGIFQYLGTAAFNLFNLLSHHQNMH